MPSGRRCSHKKTPCASKNQSKIFGKNLETYVLQGEKGKFNTQTKEIEVFDGVKVNSSDGYQFLTRSLRYQSGKKELSHTRSSRNERPPGPYPRNWIDSRNQRSAFEDSTPSANHPFRNWGFKIHHDRLCEMARKTCFIAVLTLSLIFSTFEVGWGEEKKLFSLGKVGKGDSRSDQPLHITSQQLEVDNKKSVIIFSGKVVAKQGEMIIYAESPKSIMNEKMKAMRWRDCSNLQKSKNARSRSIGNRTNLVLSNAGIRKLL